MRLKQTISPIGQMSWRCNFRLPYSTIYLGCLAQKTAKWNWKLENSRQVGCSYIAVALIEVDVLSPPLHLSASGQNV